MISPLLRHTHKLSGIYIELEDLANEKCFYYDEQFITLFRKALEAISKIHKVLNEMEDNK